MQRKIYKMPVNGTVNNTVNKEEIHHFAKDSAHWWDEHGPFKPLHRLNPVRLSYIRAEICAHFGLDDEDMKPFAGLDILDVGCGGGIVCEPMARMGGNITGIDADDAAIKVAVEHAAQTGLDITYNASSTDEQTKLIKQYDVVLALEILEHVDNVTAFISQCVDLCKTGGIIIFSTLNRTTKSYALGIVAAEHILHWVPKGTHQWEKFLRPYELATHIQNTKARPQHMKGLIFNPLKNEFALSDKDFDVNYFMTATKMASKTEKAQK